MLYCLLMDDANKTTCSVCGEACEPAEAAGAVCWYCLRHARKQDPKVTKRATRYGLPGDTVTGRTRDGKRWTATVGPSGRLIGRVVQG